MQRIVLMNLLFAGFAFLTSFTSLPNENRIVGVWQSADNDLRIEMVSQNGQYQGRLVWFLCEENDPPMSAHRDTENPNPALRHRPWLGMTIVERLTYQGHNEWSGGKVYDPNTGRTFEASVWLTAPDRITVRGYWKLPLFGRNLQFRRVDDANREPAGLAAKK